MSCHKILFWISPVTNAIVMMLNFLDMMSALHQKIRLRFLPKDKVLFRIVSFAAFAMRHAIISVTRQRLYVNRHYVNRRFHMPSATWSLEDLNLTSSPKPIPEEELQKLANRACIDLAKIQDKENLCQQVSNMLQCLEYVKRINLPELTLEEIYDDPRGLTTAPCRKSTLASSFEIEEANDVRRKLLQNKMKAIGGHYYFIIDTGVEKKQP
jgi:hypothetical protein